MLFEELLDLSEDLLFLLSPSSGLSGDKQVPLTLYAATDIIPLILSY
jgi:hypothetical protein